MPPHGSLESWAQHGVLLLNTALTVSIETPRSHPVWSGLTDEIIRAIAAKLEPVAFLLWGNHAKWKAALIDDGRHVLVGLDPSVTALRSRVPRLAAFQSCG